MKNNDSIKKSDDKKNSDSIKKSDDKKNPIN